MKLIEIDQSKKDLYNQFVAGSPSGSFLQSWEWGQWQTRLGRAVYRFKVIDDSQAQIGSLQLINMPLPLGKFYLYAPYGPIISDKLKVESEKLLHEIKQKFPKALFIRIEPKDNSIIEFLNHSIFKSKNIQPGKTLLITLGQTEETLLANMHHKTRYNIKVAQKHGVEVQDEFAVSVGHGLYFKEALNLICETADRQGFSGYGINYYKKLVDFFALSNQSAVKIHLYKAIYQKDLLASALMVDFGKTRTFLFGGSSASHKNVMAPYLMHWQAMRDAKALGFEIYDFWGTATSSGEIPGFVRFKLGFGGKEMEYPGAYDAINKEFDYKIYSWLRSAKKKAKKIFGH